MKKRSYLAGVLSLLLALLGTYTTYTLFVHYDFVSFTHMVLAILGFAGATMVLCGKVSGKWFLAVFYLVQVLEVFAGEFRFAVNVGISFPIRQFFGGMDEVMKNPHGVGINLLAVGMLVLTFMISKNEVHSQSAVASPKTVPPES